MFYHSRSAQLAGEAAKHSELCSEVFISLEDIHLIWLKSPSLYANIRILWILLQSLLREAHQWGFKYACCSFLSSIIDLSLSQHDRF